MSLGAKIKEVLTGSSPTETSPEDRNIPGSFPTDDVPRPEGAVHGGPDLLTSGSQRNKLHKPNDPRGDGGALSTPKGHSHTDSGVGLTESDYAQHSIERKPVAGFAQDAPGAGSSPEQAYPRRAEDDFNSKTAPTGQTTATSKSAGYGATRYPTQEAAFAQGTSGTPKQVRGGRDAPGMTDLDQREVQASTPVKSSRDPERREEPNVIRSDFAAKSSSEHKDPYWGDIPSGAGVYNTVTGHGSPEDANRRDAAHARDTHAAPAGSGAMDDAAGHRAFPLGGTTHPEEAGYDNSRSKQAAAGAAGIAGASLTAHGLDKKHDERAVQEAVGEDRKAEDTSHAKSHKESKIAGLFPGDHKESKEYQPETKREKSSDEYRHRQKEGGIMGFAHRDHKDEESKEIKKAEKEATKEDKRNQKKDEAAVAAASAYSAHAATEEHDRKKDVSRKPEAEQPKEKKESKLHALFHRSHKDKDDEVSKEGKHLSEHNNKSHQTAAVAPVARGHETQTRSTGREQLPPQPAQAGTTPWRDDVSTGDKHSNLGRDAIAAGAGGAAAYGASKHAHKDDAPKATDQMPRVPPATSLASTQQAQRQTYPAPGHYDATAPGPPFSDTYQSGGVGPQSRDVPSMAAPSLPPRNPETTQQPEPIRLHEHRQDDKYNILPSGTASGVKVGDDTYHSREPATASPLAKETQHGGHRAAPMAAAAGAAGVGAAAYGSKHGGDEPAVERQQGSRPTEQAVPARTQPKEYMESRPLQTATSGMPTGPTGSGQKVIHQCHKCGEANDISHYFTK